MHQTRKANQWHFGIKVGIGVVANSELLHKVRSTAANAQDITQAHAPLHGEEEMVFADSVYLGVQKCEKV